MAEGLLLELDFLHVFDSVIFAVFAYRARGLMRAELQTPVHCAVGLSGRLAAS
jgi:hypothetical protein